MDDAKKRAEDAAGWCVKASDDARWVAHVTDVIASALVDAERRALERAAERFRAEYEPYNVIPSGSVARALDDMAAALSPAEPKAEPAGGGVEREGPRRTVEHSCQGCSHERSEYYAVQGDSGWGVYCVHPTVGRKSVGDSTWQTPAWCPLLSPVTYRAGTRPERIEVGMVLRGPSGRDGVVERVTDVYAYFTDGRSYLNSVVREWPLARDWPACTKPECAECKGDGWQRTRLADGTLRHGPMACPACTKPDEPGPNAVSQREALPNGARDRLDSEDDGGGR